MFARICAAAFVVSILSAGHAFAQDATVVGTVMDESKSVLPGVTITAAEVTTGRQFIAVTTDRGEYRLVGLPPGRYRIQAELPGFATVIVPEVELLVGQNAAVSLTLKVADLNETLTVTGEAPLVDTRSAQVAGNVDRRQMEELPILGRNWMELSLMVKGVTANTIAERPGVNADAKFQLNLDGQQITQQISLSGSYGQPRLSREAIAEYQIVTNMFDVTLGRSTGLQVQAITRSGTNAVDGSFYGNIRDDRFNSEDFFTGQVLPYSNQQIGGSLGGPILKDRAHYFGSYEYEREPSTQVIAPAALAPQRMNMPTKAALHSALGRVDYQLGNKDHLTGRTTGFRRLASIVTGHPSRGHNRQFDSNVTTINWSRVLNTELVQEVKGGYYYYHWLFAPWSDVTLGPEYTFPGLSLGASWSYPEEFWEHMGTIRYDLTWHKGRHDLKVGGEFMRAQDGSWWPAQSRGRFRFSALPADAARRFPLDAWNDPSRWDFTGLDPLVLRFDRNYANDWSIDIPRPTYAAWIGDTWAVNDRVTLNLGVRYDLAWGDTAPPHVTETDVIIDNGKFTENVGYRNDIRDLNNVAPRVGFIWKASGDNDFVIRGGSGLFYGNTSSTQALEQQLFNAQKVLAASYPNDRQPGFLLDPTRGITEQDVFSGRVPLPPQAISVIAHDFVFPYTWQSMLGFQKQLGAVLAVDADLVHWRGYHEDSQRDPNLFYDPVTGFNKHPNTAGRPARLYGPINLRESEGRSEYLALATSLSRRYLDNFQIGLTYTLMFLYNDTGAASAGYGATQLNPFDINVDWSRSADFQRHTLRANGIWNLRWGFTLAGSYQFGSGNYSTITSGFDPFGTGGSRVRRDFTVIGRNTFKGDPVQKFDLRVAKEFRLAGDVRITGIAEVFNAFNYERFGYNTLETSPAFGRPNSGGAPRSGQLAFKVSF